jgi:hypothetical protein
MPLLEEWHQPFEQGRRRNRVARPRVNTEQPAFVVVKVDEIETDAAGA